MVIPSSRRRILHARHFIRDHKIVFFVVFPLVPGSATQQQLASRPFSFTPGSFYSSGPKSRCTGRHEGGAFVAFFESWDIVRACSDSDCPSPSRSLRCSSLESALP